MVKNGMFDFFPLLPFFPGEEISYDEEQYSHRPDLNFCVEKLYCYQLLSDLKYPSPALFISSLGVKYVCKLLTNLSLFFLADVYSFISYRLYSFFCSPDYQALFSLIRDKKLPQAAPQ